MTYHMLSDFYGKMCWGHMLKIETWGLAGEYSELLSGYKTNQLLDKNITQHISSEFIFVQLSAQVHAAAYESPVCWTSTNIIEGQDCWQKYQKHLN